MPASFTATLDSRSIDLSANPVLGVGGAGRVLGFSTAAFTLLFAVWLMFGLLALPIRKEFRLNDVQFSWLTAIAILNGALWRLPLCFRGVDLIEFTALVVAVGVAMGIGKAAVFKYIPDYFPNDVGAVGGLVGCLGALGGFVLPLLFAYLGKSMGRPEATWMLMLAVTVVSLL